MQRREPPFRILKSRFAVKSIDVDSFNDTILVKTKKGELIISSLEKQIAFKRFYLRSDKDIEDAKFIEEVFKDKINKEKVNQYRRLLEQ